MNWADQRLDVKEIKNHPWFYGADWNSLRYIEPPFVPRLNSITDTSYFPTDDLGNVSNQLDNVESVSAEKDLAFLGYAHCVPIMTLSLIQDTSDSRLNASLVVLKPRVKASVGSDAGSSCIFINWRLHTLQFMYSVKGDGKKFTIGWASLFLCLQWGVGCE